MFLYGFISLLLIVATFEDPVAILAGLSPAFVAWLVWRFVRRINLRDDPRFAKRPPDAPRFMPFQRPSSCGICQEARDKAAAQTGTPSRLTAPAPPG